MKMWTEAKKAAKKLEKCRKKGKTVGFVPTMGFLHKGHLSLVKQAKRNNDVVIVSIFVNPTQFAPGEDFEVYPRDLDRDLAMLKKAGVDFVFAPDKEEMYPDGFATTIHMTGITEMFCGGKRPGHFDGVCTVVTKLFNIVKPHNAYFGLKDYQQYLVVSRLVKDLNIPCAVIGVPTVREADGLALSSRNVFLKAEERESALSLSRSFRLIQKHLDQGEYSPQTVLADVVNFIELHPHTEIDYADFASPQDLSPVRQLDGPFICMLAAKVGSVRLIDSKVFGV